MYNQVCQNRLHFDNPDGGLTDAQICDEINTFWLPIIRALQNVGFAYTSISSQNVSTAGNMPFVLSIAGTTGTLSGAGAHPSIAGLFTIRTALATRRGRGRFYMPGVHGESVSNGLNGALGAYATQAGILTTRYNFDTGTRPIFLGVYEGGIGGVWHGMTQLIARQTFGIQRKRNINVGV
jgi:hypothetical protein